VALLGLAHLHFVRVNHAFLNVCGPVVFEFPLLCELLVYDTMHRQFGYAYELGIRGDAGLVPRNGRKATLCVPVEMKRVTHHVAIRHGVQDLFVVVRVCSKVLSYVLLPT
jgi:hypothetical protein